MMTNPHFSIDDLEPLRSNGDWGDGNPITFTWTGPDRKKIIEIENFRSHMARGQLVDIEGHGLKILGQVVAADQIPFSIGSATRISITIAKISVSQAPGTSFVTNGTNPIQIETTAPGKPPEPKVFRPSMISYYLGEPIYLIVGRKPKTVVHSSDKGWVEEPVKVFEARVRKENDKLSSPTGKFRYTKIQQADADKMTGIDRFKDEATDEVMIDFDG